MRRSRSIGARAWLPVAAALFGVACGPPADTASRCPGRGARAPVARLAPDANRPTWAAARYGVPVARRHAARLGAVPLPPAPRVGVPLPSDVPLSVRADVENPRVHRAGGRTHLRLTIVGGTMPSARPTSTIAPGVPAGSSDVWLYVDTSGSMGPGTLQAAVSAAHVLVRRLRPYDRLGVVAYGTSPRVLRGLRPVGDGGDAHRAIDRLTLGGGAPPQGPPEVVATDGRDAPLVIWITDGAGQASRPIRDRARGVAAHALVVGDRADAADLRAIAATPGALLRYLPDSRALAPAIARALYAHRAALLRELEIVVAPAPGARIVRAYGADVDPRGGVSVRLPSLSRGAEAVVLVEIEVPPGAPGASAAIADYGVSYRMGPGVASIDSEAQGRVAGRVRVVHANDADELLASRDRGVARTILAARTGDALESAGVALAEGDTRGARRALDEQEELLAIAAGSLGEAWIHRDADVVAAYARTVRRAPEVFDAAARDRVAARMVFEGAGRMRR